MKIAVVGATGLVGGVMLKVLAERGFAGNEIVAAASPKSVGKRIPFADRELTVVSVDDAIAMRPDFAIFSAGAAASRQYAPLFAAARARAPPMLPVPMNPIIGICAASPFFFPYYMAAGNLSIPERLLRGRFVV